jgi:hypothetical protein
MRTGAVAVGAARAYDLAAATRPDATVAGRAPTAASPASTEKPVVRRRTVRLLAHGTGWMSPHEGDRCFEYGVLDRA